MGEKKRDTIGTNAELVGKEGEENGEKCSFSRDGGQVHASSSILANKQQHDGKCFVQPRAYKIATFHRSAPLESLLLVPV